MIAGPKTFSRACGFRRKGWTFRSGGEKCYRGQRQWFFPDRDGEQPGTSWMKRAGQGLPATLGARAVTIAPSKPNVFTR